MKWPVKILLVHPKAEFLQEDKFTIAADCSLLIRKDIAERFDDEAVIIGCPMLEDPRRVFEKIKMIVKETSAKKVDVFTMEVPCCHAIHMMVRKAVEESGKSLEVSNYIVRISGDVEEYSGSIDESMVEAERRAHRGM